MASPQETRPVNPANMHSLFADLKPNLALEEPLKPSSIEKDDIVLKFSDLEREAQNATSADTFQGFRTEITSALKNIHVIQVLTYGGSQSDPPYTLLATYIPQNLYNLTARVNSGGEFQGFLNFNKSWPRLGSIVGRIALMYPPKHMKSEPSAYSFECDYHRGDFVASAKAATGPHGQQFSLGYVQRLHKSLPVLLGIEGQLQSAPGMQYLSVVTLGTRYDDTVNIGVAQFEMAPFSTNSLALSYARRISNPHNPFMTLATTYKIKRDQKNASQYTTEASIGADFKCQVANVRTRISSDLTLATVLENQIAPQASLVLSASANFKKADYRFGLGLNFFIQDQMPPPQ